MIDLHFFPVPNGRKVTILLEELGWPYRLVPANFTQGVQFTDDFLRISPNARMPAIVDREPADGGQPIAVFESAAIMMYIAEKAGRFWPQTARQKYQVAQWVVWQAANQGPKFGEAGHFIRLRDSKGDQSYAVKRFTDEANRICGVLNDHLYDRRFIAGDDYSIADMISYPWTAGMSAQGQDIAEFPYLQRWFDEIGARPGVQRGMAAGSELAIDPTTLTAAQQEAVRKLLYNQRARPVRTNGRTEYRAQAVGQG